MKFGVMLNHQYLADEDLGARIDEGVEQTELIRDLGYDRLFSHHHFLANLQTPQPIPILSHLVPYSGDMKLGIAVYIATLEHPVAIAETFATLDQISKGRMIFGVGAGYREHEFETFGVPHKTRLSRLYETIDVCRALWSGEPVTFHGKHFDLDEQRIGFRPRQGADIPVWIGANGPKTIVRGAAHCDTWIASPHLKFRWLNGNLAAFKEEQERLGIDTAGCEYPCVRELYIANTDAAARVELEPYLGKEYEMFGNYDSVYDNHYEEMWEKAFFVGSPDSVAAKIETLAEGGWNSFIFRCSWPGMPHEMTMRTIQRFADEVMPRFAGTAVGTTHG